MRLKTYRIAVKKFSAVSAVFFCAKTIWGCLTRHSEIQNMIQQTVYFRSVSTFLNSCMTQVLDLESTNLPTSRKRWNLWFLPDACLWNAADGQLWSIYRVFWSHWSGLGVDQNRLTQRYPDSNAWRLWVMKVQDPMVLQMSTPKKWSQNPWYKTFVVVVACRCMLINLRSPIKLD